MAGRSPGRAIGTRHHPRGGRSSVHAPLSSVTGRCDRDPRPARGMAENVIPPRYNQAVIIYEHRSPAEQADRFLRSSAGRALINHILATNRLPRFLADDLRQDAVRRVWVATADSPVGIDNLSGFVATVLQRAAVDIVRGRVRAPQAMDWQQVIDLDAAGWGWPFDGHLPLDVEADVLSGESLAAVRRAIHRGLAVDPASGAAALAYLTVAVDGAPVPPDCPQPAGGATATEAAEWAALWYAGHRHCFGGPAVPTAAPVIRKRRSRLVRRFRDRLTFTARLVGLEREGALDG
jgi:DNA-directed RNA polymerase specialized sigma24 family protein